MKTKRQVPLSPRRRAALIWSAVAAASAVWYFIWRAGFDAEFEQAVVTKNAARVHELLQQGANARGTIRSSDLDFFEQAAVDLRNAGSWRGIWGRPTGPGPTRAIPMSLLEHAVAMGNCQIATDLLDHGADPNYAREDGTTLLFQAANGLPLDYARMLLRHGARVDARIVGGATPLHRAAYADSIGAIGIFLDAGAQIEARDSAGRTPIHQAARNSAAHAVALLIDRGADIQAKDDAGETPLALAARFHAPASIDVLLDRGGDPADLHRRPDDEPLVWIAARGDLPLLKRLWERVLTPDQRIREGRDALAAAAAVDSRPAVEYLLERGVDVNAEAAVTPSTGNRISGGPMMLKPGSALASGSAVQPSILSMAAQSADPAMFRYLLAHGARVNPETKFSDTPLMAAVRLAVGLRPSPRQNDGVLGGGMPIPGFATFKPMPMRERGEWRAIVQLLLERGADVRAVAGNGATALHFAAYDPDLVRILVARGADVRARGSGGVTPLHGAVSNTAATELLLAKGADPNAKDARGVTPLMVACQLHGESVGTLISASADVNAADSAGTTPLMYAVSNRLPGETPEAVRLLLKHGADLSLRDDRGQTALMRAESPESSRVGGFAGPRRVTPDTWRAAFSLGDTKTPRQASALGELGTLLKANPPGKTR